MYTFEINNNIKVEMDSYSLNLKSAGFLSKLVLIILRYSVVIPYIIKQFNSYDAGFLSKQLFLICFSMHSIRRNNNSTTISFRNYPKETPPPLPLIKLKTRISFNTNLTFLLPITN